MQGLRRAARGSEGLLEFWRGSGGGAAVRCVRQAAPVADVAGEEGDGDGAQKANQSPKPKSNQLGSMNGLRGVQKWVPLPAEMVGGVHRPRWVVAWPTEVAAVLRASLAARGSAEGLLEFLRSSGTSQKWLWLLRGRFGFLWVLHCGVGSLRSSVALWAERGALAAAWRSGECGGGLRLRLWSFRSEMAWFGFFGQILGVGVCGGL